MKKKITLLLFASILLFVSCDFGEAMQIKNCTNDSIIICYSNDSCIDSVKYLLDCCGVTFEPTDTLSMRQEFQEEERLVLTNGVIIPPDSLGEYHTFNTHLFYDNPQHKGHFFIIKLDDAQKYTWGEICSDALYESLIVTRKQVKAQKSPIIACQIVYYQRVSIS